MDKGILYTKQLDHYTTASELRTEASYSELDAKTKLQR